MREGTDIRDLAALADKIEGLTTAEKLRLAAGLLENGVNHNIVQNIIAGAVAEIRLRDRRSRP